ncbi:MAG: nicotinate phosphoribosyltransferase [Spirochaetaceae bacterium]|nr:MAG: nicotinate phosphoribosyltransferase [Spirochaetaceae bacterium]
MSPGALFTDLYELTMAQGYHRYQMNPRVVFDMFFRRNPFGGGFTVCAGIEPLMDALASFTFAADDIDYLRSLDMFDAGFLDYLSAFRFAGDVYAVGEGTVVFPGAPMIRVHANLIEAQLIEGLLLNTVNFQTLIATKTARVFLASNRGRILEFGLRRAQGIDGALSATRAAFIGGAAATSNTLAGKRFGIPVSGTMAHSWVMAFDSERDAFEKYADLYPDKTILLVDTYDTLRSGIKNAAEVGRALAERGKTLGVRLDSGDIQYLSHAIRRYLDEHGLRDATIAVSNELNEEIIHALVADGCPIDFWGVGTNLVTGGSDSALTGVYKLAAKERDGKMVPTMKISDNPDKTTDPGVKQVHRIYDRGGSPIADVIGFDEETIETGTRATFYHPAIDYRHFSIVPDGEIRPLLEPVMKSGRVCADLPSIHQIQERAKREIDSLDPTYTRLINPHRYKVSITERLKDVKAEMIAGFIDG